MQIGYSTIDHRKPPFWQDPFFWFCFLTFIIFVLFIKVNMAKAAEIIDIEKLATAIYYAKGGAKTKFPYGILTRYKHTMPRQACINTIRHAQRDWNGRGDFISFLQKRYAPIGASNDPKELNKNWICNVRYFYNKKIKGGNNWAGILVSKEK